MTEELSHERCSELLPGFLEGALPGDDARLVEDHLASCEECRMEKLGLETLTTGEIEGLTAMERAALERGVMGGISEDTATTEVIPLAPRRRIGARVAGALGAAAVVAVIATLAYFGSSGGLDEATMGGADTGERAEENAVGERDRSGRGGRRRHRVAAGKVSDSTALNAESETGTAFDTAQGPAPVPTFRVEERRLSGPVLQKRGASSLDSVRAAAYYSYDDTSGARTLLEQLVDAARTSAGDEVADQVDECATRVLETSDPAVPTFGILGTLDDREVLVLGFAYTRASSGNLDRYMVWAWERGSCEVAVDFVEGKIETAN